MTNRVALRFVVTAGLLSVALFGILRVPWVEQNLLLPFTGAQWKLACQIGGDPDAPVTVSLSCSAADVIALCLGFVLAFPVSWRRRLIGASLGLLFIAAVNTLRIATLSRVVTDRDLFNTLHIYVWPAVLLVVVSLFVFVWMSRSLRAEGVSTDSSNDTDRPGYSLSSEGKRFVVLSLIFIALFVGTSQWWMKSGAVLTVAKWVAAFGALVIRLFGGEATLIGNYLKTSNGGFMVTQECIMTPLVPVYLAATFSLAMTRWKRIGALLLAGPVFFVLGAARLLVLAFPANLIGSPLTAIHGFYQIVLAALLIGLSAYKSKTQSESPTDTLKRGALAIVGSVLVTLVIALTWNRILLGGLGRLQAIVAHAGHGFIDPQGAIVLMAPYQIGLLTGLWLAWRPRPEATRLLISLGLLGAIQILSVLVFGEWSTHTSLEPHVALIRAWSVALPVLFFLRMVQPNQVTGESGLIPIPETGNG
jgi:exosortase/archaeosortase family protein